MNQLSLLPGCLVVVEPARALGDLTRISDIEGIMSARVNLLVPARKGNWYPHWKVTRTVVVPLARVRRLDLSEFAAGCSWIWGKDGRALMEGTPGG